MPGNYTITETTVPSWVLTDITITGSTGVVNASTAVVQLQLGEHAIVTYTNQLEVTLKLTKQLVNPPTGVVLNDFDLSATAAAPNDAYNFTVVGTGTNKVFAGVPYTLTETGPIGNSTVTFTGSGNVVVVGNVVTVMGLGSNEVVVTNTYPLGTITVVKITNSPFANSFNFTGNLGAFALNTGNATTFSNLLTGTYNITETLVAGWVLTNIAITGANGSSLANTATVNLEPGQNAIVVFTNQATAPLTLKKAIINPPAGVIPNSFTLSASASAPNNGNNFSVIGSGSGNVFMGVPYTLTETGPPGNHILSLTGSGAVGVVGNVVTVTGFAANEVVFTNTYIPSRITVRKVASGNQSQTFNFTGTLGNFNLNLGGSIEFSPLSGGSYSITETVPVGWNTPMISIINGSGIVAGATVTINLLPGQDVIVTFTNQPT
jgi:hypothetical protein